MTGAQRRAGRRVVRALRDVGPTHPWRLARVLGWTPERVEAALRLLQDAGRVELEHLGVRREPVWSLVRAKNPVFHSTKAGGSR